MSATAPLKILLGTDFYHPHIGGIETHVAALAKAFTDMGHEVVVAAPGQSLFGRQTDIDPDAHCKVWRVGSSLIFGFSSNLRVSWRPRHDLKPFLAQWQPDVIHVNNHFGIGRALVEYGRAHDIPVVAVNHTMPEAFIWWAMGYNQANWRYRFLKDRYWKWVFSAYNQASIVTGPTHMAIDELVKLGLKPKALAVSNGVDIVANIPATKPKPELRAQLGLPERPTILYLGRVDGQKRVDILVKALPEVAKTIDVQLVIVGPGDQTTALPALAKKLGVGDRVILKAPVYDPKLKTTYYQAADLFGIASPIESQSIVTLEAIACGLPIVATNTGALPELAKPGVNGELFELEDISEVTAKLIKVLQSAELRQAYGIQSRKLAEQHDIRHLPQNFLNLYQEIMRPR